MQSLCITDVHCHVLPGLDDGAVNEDESIELLRQACALGIKSVIATPHYSRRSEGSERADRIKALAGQLEARARVEIDDGFRVYPGEETVYHDELISRLNSGEALTLAGSRYVLIEFMTDTPLSDIYRQLRRLTESGYRPVVAHIERYDAIMSGSYDETAERIEEITGRGSFVQMGYDSIDDPDKTGFSRLIGSSALNPVVRKSRRLIKEGYVHLLATDMHRLDFRPPQIDGALRWMNTNLKPEETERMVFLNPERIIGNKELK